MTHEEFEAFRYLERPSGPPVRVPITNESNENPEPTNAFISASHKGGDVEFPSVSIPAHLVREAISAGSSTVSWTESTVTIDLGFEGGLQIHIHIAD